MSAPWPSARALPLSAFPTAAPGLRFAVRCVGSPERGSVQHGADLPHPLAGTGKLFLAVAVARLAERDPELLGVPLTIGHAHRAGARTGTLRLMAGDLQLTVDDAMALIVGTGDGACGLALLEVLEARGEDVLAEARRLAAALGLAATTFTGLEASTRAADGDRPGESWGEGLLGTTTPADLSALLVHVLTTGTPASERVLGWMSTAFEPAGLASALPGFGPRTIPHRTVSGFELRTPPGAPGCASVLILPADVGHGRPTTCVAAYHPRTRADGSAVPSRETSAVLGSLGLAAAASTG